MDNKSRFWFDSRGNPRKIWRIVEEVFDNFIYISMYIGAILALIAAAMIVYRLATGGCGC